MREAILVTVPSLVTAVITRLLTLRQSRAKLDAAELDNIRREMELYRQLLTDTKKFLQEARGEIAHLTQKVEALTKTNAALDSEIKQLRRLINHYENRQTADSSAEPKKEQ